MVDRKKIKNNGTDGVVPLAKVHKGELKIVNFKPELNWVCDCYGDLIHSGEEWGCFHCGVVNPYLNVMRKKYTKSDDFTPVKIKTMSKENLKIYRENLKKGLR